MSKVIEVTDQNFQKQVIECKQLCLVDFWAQWCGPCLAIAPVIEQLADDYQEKVTFTKLNIDTNSKTPMQYNIMSIPSLIFFKDGQEVDRIIGGVPKNKIEDVIKNNL